MALCVVPLYFSLDVNGGFSNLGFTRTTLKQEFKSRPDFMTGKVFVANRATMKDL